MTAELERSLSRLSLSGGRGEEELGRDEEEIRRELSRLSITDWSEEAERAAVHLRVSPLYFSLPLYRIGPVPPRDVTPLYRYLEVGSQEKITPESAAYVDYSTETVGGIYEALAGVYEAVKRNNEPVLLFFLGRLSPEKKEVLVGDVMSGVFFSSLPPVYLPFRTRALRRLFLEIFGGYDLLRRVGYYPEEWQIRVEEMAYSGVAGVIDAGPEKVNEALSYFITLGSEEALTLALRLGYRLENIFIAAIRSGRADFLDRVFFLRPTQGIPIYGERIGEVVVPGKPFVLPGRTYPVPVIPRPRSIPGFIYPAVSFCGNPQIYDYFRAVSGNLYPAFYPDEFVSGYYIHGRPQGFYSVAERLASRDLLPSIAVNVDLSILVMASTGPSHFASTALKIVEHNKGVLDIVTTLAGFLRETIVAPGYPLTEVLTRR